MPKSLFICFQLAPASTLLYIPFFSSFSASITVYITSGFDSATAIASLPSFPSGNPL